MPTVPAVDPVTTPDAAQHLVAVPDGDHYPSHPVPRRGPDGEFPVADIVAAYLAGTSITGLRHRYRYGGIRQILVDAGVTLRGDATAKP